MRGFVNRVAELAKLDGILAEEGEDQHAVSVWVITGTAGVGKTSLALHWAHRIRERFPDGQLHINLRGYDPGPPVTAAAALDHFLRALNIEVGSIPSDLQAKSSLYRSLVADKRILIVLDNAATVAQVRPLLPGTSTCLVLVTSRSNLPGLAVRDGARRIAVTMLTDEEAVTLLSVVTAGYRAQDDPAELAELARLCARLPLALRIAAERAAGRPQMPLNELIQDLRDESALWDALSTDNDEEADAVRTVFAWTYRALSPAAARLFRLLGLHPGPGLCVAAAAALVGQPAGQVRPALDSLIRANLLEQTGADCYEFHDLLRAYAVDQVRREESKDDQLAALHRVLGWYLHTAEAARRSIVPGGFAYPIALDPLDSQVVPDAFTDDVQAIHWYETQRTNLMSATHAAAGSGFDRIAWQFPAILGRVYANRDPVDTWLDAELTAFDAARRGGDRYGEAVLHDSLGIRYRATRRLTEAADQHRAAIEIFRELGDRFGEARAANGLGNVYVVGRELEKARDQFARTLTISRELDNRSLAALSLTNLGMISLELGSLADAENYLQEAVVLRRELGEHWDGIISERMLGATRRELGRLAAARESLQYCLDYTRAHRDHLGESLVLLELGRLEVAEGSHADALVSSQRAAATFRQLGVRDYEAFALDVSGKAYQGLGRLEDAMAFHRQAVAIHRQLGDNCWQAIALDNLASALRQNNRTDDAREAWREAFSLLDGLNDPLAMALRTRIGQQLG